MAVESVRWVQHLMLEMIEQAVGTAPSVPVVLDQLKSRSLGSILILAEQFDDNQDTTLPSNVCRTC